MGGGENNHHFGFYLIDGNLYGSCANGSARSTQLLISVSMNTEYLLEARFTPGVGIDFYVDEVYRGQITTNLPSGTTYAAFYLNIGVYPQEASQKDIYVGEWVLSQE